jgi:hypothetical protein
MAKTWQAASKEAMTVLGPKGKIPEPNQTSVKTAVAMNKTFDEFKAAAQALKDAFDAHASKFDLFLGALEANKDEIEKDDLGLNPKDKEDAKKIKKAHAILSAALQGVIDKQTGELADLKKFGKSIKAIIDFEET